MSKEPIIETDRLILRPITLDDAEACFSWNSDERVTNSNFPRQKWDSHLEKSIL